MGKGAVVNVPLESLGTRFLPFRTVTSKSPAPAVVCKASKDDCTIKQVNVLTHKRFSVVSWTSAT